MSIGHDKLVHFVVGLSIAVIAGIGCLAIGIDPLWAMLPVAIAGIGKELWDAMGHGTVELLDLIASIAGGAVAVGIIKMLG